MQFFGRAYELERLQTLWTTVVRKSESRLVTLTGRRGVGKTTLLHQAFRGRDGIRYVHFFVPEGSSARRIAALWSGVLSRALGFSASTLGETPFEVLRTAVELTRDDPAVIVVDECQRLDREEPDFWGRLQHLWDSKRKSTRALLIMCGSDAAALERISTTAARPCTAARTNRCGSCPKKIKGPQAENRRAFFVPAPPLVVGLGLRISGGYGSSGPFPSFARCWASSRMSARSRSASASTAPRWNQTGSPVWS